MNTLPKHLARGGVNHENLLALQRWATTLSHLYWQPIYLVGSCLAEANLKPRDWDVRIEMPDDEFAVKFGDVYDWVQQGVTGEWSEVRHKWSSECTKWTKDAWKMTGLNVDFQVYPQSNCYQYAKLRRYPLVGKA